MKYLLYCLLVVFALVSCEKEVEIDKKSLLSARINSMYLSVNNAKAKLEHSNYFTDKGQLTITGEDNNNRIDILIKDYTAIEGVISLDNDKATAVYIQKATNMTDTVSAGRIVIEEIVNNFYSIPDLPSGSFTGGQVYKSQLIVGTFEFVTRNQISVTGGIFGISFNR